MKRHVIATCAVAVAVSLAATPAIAAMGPSAHGLSAESSQATAAALPSGDVGAAELRASRLRDKMPFFAREPHLVGRNLEFAVNVSPMRGKASARAGLLDRVGGWLTVSRRGVDMASAAEFAHGTANRKVLLQRKIPTRVIHRAGLETYRLRLPRAVADEIRALKRTRVAHRVRVVMWNDKDTTASVSGYDRRQLTASFMPPALISFLKSRRDAAATSGRFRQSPKAAMLAAASGRSMVRAFPAKDTTDTFGTVVVYNGSPFDLTVAMNYVQCMTPYLANWSLSPGSLASNASFEFSQVAEIAGNTFYDSDLSRVEDSATSGMDSLKTSASQNLQRAAYLNNITGSAARGLLYFGTSMATSLTGAAVAGAIADSNACTNAGSAINLSWTNASVGSGQTAGNVNYWVPSYSRTSGIGSPAVKPTSIPAVAPGSPLTAYNATSANGLAVSPGQLRAEIGLGGSVTLTTLNSAQRNGSYDGFWCNYRDQQIGNPNSSPSTAQYGSSALGGGTSPDWGVCNATSVTGSPDYLQDYFGDSNAGQLENEGFSVLIGYSSTSLVTAGPAPALPSTSAASASACSATDAPCIYTVTPTSTAPDLTVGCTPGDWDLLTPWNGSDPSMSLSNPPSAYSAESYLSTQLGYKGVTASGDPITNLVPASDGGSVSSSFSPSAVNPFSLSTSDLAAIQNSLGGAGGYVTDWLCVMNANTMVPSGIAYYAPSATAMNLGWSGVPAVASVPNPAGNLLSPPS